MSSTGAWVCIIGGGRSQLPFVEAAATRGLETVVFDVDPNAPACSVATEFVAMSTHDTAGVISHLESSPRALAGCFTYSSYEAALLTTTAVVDRFAVRGLSTESFTRTSSKTEMRKHLLDAGLPVAASQTTADPNELDAFRDIHGAVVIKPAQGSVGSAGVARLDETASNASELLGEACRLSSDGLAIVEQFLGGREYSVDGFVMDGDVRVLAASRKYVLDQHFVISGYVTGPGAVSPGIESQLEEVAARALAAFALDNSYFSLDVIETDGEFFVIDAGPLLDAKVDRLLHHAGVDVYGIASDVALGRVPKMTDLDGKAHGLRFIYSDGPGVLSVGAPGRFGETDMELILEMEKAIGDEVTTPSSVADVLGWITTSVTDGAGLWSALGTVDLSDRIEVGDRS
jgi:biotin carboxylase